MKAILCSDTHQGFAEVIRNSRLREIRVLFDIGQDFLRSVSFYLAAYVTISSARPLHSDQRVLLVGVHVPEKQDQVAPPFLCKPNQSK